MINIRAISRSSQYLDTYLDNHQKELNALNTEATASIIKPHEKLVKIDKYYFTTKSNISSLDTEITLGIKKLDTLSKPIYLNIGSSSERLTFTATIHCDDILHFDGFKAKVLKAKPLSISTATSDTTRQILIDKLSYKNSNFALNANKTASFASLEISISGILL